MQVLLSDIFLSNYQVKPSDEYHPGTHSKIDMINNHPDEKANWSKLDGRIKDFFPTFYPTPAPVRF